jgi:hypothetical protein
MQVYERVAHPDHTDLSPLALADAARSFRDALRENRPAVVFFPGVQTVEGGVIHGAPVIDSLNYKSHLLERHLGGGGIYGTGLKFFAVAYSPQATRWAGGSWIQHRYGRAGDARTFLEHPNDYFSGDANAWTEQFLLPSLKDDEGQWLALPEMQKRLSHVTFFGDSYGSIFAEQIANCLKQKLGKAGFAPKDISSLLRSIVLVAASNIPQRTSDAGGHQVGHYTGIYLEGNNDHFIQGSRAIRLSHAQQMGRSMFMPCSAPVREEDYHPTLPPLDFELNDAIPYQVLSAHDDDRAQDDRMNLPPLQESSLRFTRIHKGKGGEADAHGIRVSFDVPQNYTLRVRIGPETKLLRWHNTENHQSGSYFGMGDQQHVVARALRNAVRLGQQGLPRTPEAVLATRAMPIVCHSKWEGYETAIQDRMDQLIPLRMADMPLDDGVPELVSRRDVLTGNVGGFRALVRQGAAQGRRAVG